MVAKLDAACVARDRYEDARAAAVKSGAVSNEQLDSMGYRKTPKLPASPQRVTNEETHTGASGAPQNSSSDNGAGSPEPVLTPAGAHPESSSSDE